MIKKHLAEELPTFFYNFDTEAPFTHCLVCHEKLEDKESYAIEKVFKHNKILNKSEIVYEYAICLECAGEAQDEISAESLISIQALYEEYSANLMMKLDYLHTTEKYNIESWIERCSFTGKEVRQCNEYTVSALIENGQLVYEHTPIVVSDDFLEMLQERLSKKTRDYFDGFRDKHFDTPPELVDLIGGPTVGIL